MTTPPELTTIIRKFLETQSIMALATINLDGLPEAAPVFYVSDEQLNLYWLSLPDTRHSANLQRSARAAAVI